MRPLPAFPLASLRAWLAAAALVPALAGPLAADDSPKKKDPTPAPPGPVSGPSGVGGGASGSSGPLGPYAGPTGGTRTWTACGGPSAQSLMCAAVWVNVSGFSTVIRVQNLSGSDAAPAGSAGQWVLTTVGFDGVPPSVSALVAYWTSGTWAARTSMPRWWEAFDDGQFGGGERIDFGIDNGSGISGGIASSCAPAGTLPGGSNRLWMTAHPDCPGYAITDGSLDAAAPWFEARVITTQAWDPNAAEVGLYLKGQNGPGGASYECLVGGATPRGDCYTYSVGFPGGGAVVPEPETVLLIGTGLAGVAVMAWRRRRAEAPAGRE